MLADDLPDATFGSPPSDGSPLIVRPAAYVVVFDPAGRVAVVSADARGRARQTRPLYWLIGGGREAGETAEATVARECREELGCEVRLKRPLGRARQFFYGRDEDAWFDMTADFFAGRLVGDPTGGQPDLLLHWLDPATEAQHFFHRCHAWAVERAAGE
ncbi:MAG: NUDIX domain-containing protein [Planctomycetaceae bacterium]|nr:NUDIX domain-containing protein [Planctomycetaceae bacterium]